MRLLATATRTASSDGVKCGNHGAFGDAPSRSTTVRANVAPIRATGSRTRAVSQALRRLPATRRDAVLARSRGTLSNPLDELYYAAPGASAAAMDRFAHLVLAARDDESAWVQMRELNTLGPSFGAHLVTARGAASLPPDFITTLREMLHPEAFAALKVTPKRRAKTR